MFTEHLFVGLMWDHHWALRSGSELTPGASAEIASDRLVETAMAIRHLVLVSWQRETAIGLP